MDLMAQDDIVTLTEEIWLSAARLPVHRVEGADAAVLHGRTIDGLITISGGWQGVVVLQCDRGLAEEAARQMFDLGDRQPELADVQDALGELTNMTGGNLKALMPGECTLSLPAVVEGTDYSVRIPGTRVIERLQFACGDRPFVVSVLGAGALTAAS
ncbi:MAG: chemotaxis protein CheX [Acidobacteria bacterium]|nr:chemotaxis protein CheX [Acidobacteriota bacterium]